MKCKGLLTPALADPETQTENLFLPRRQSRQDLPGLFRHIHTDRSVRGRHDLLVFNEIAKMVVPLLSDGRLQRDRFFHYLQDLQDLFQRILHLVCDFLGIGFPSQRMGEIPGCFVELVDRLKHVHWEPDGPRLIGDGPGDRLPDPPGGIGGKFIAPLVLEFIDRLHQPDIPLLDQIQELEAPVRIFPRDAGDKTQIRLHQLSLRALRLPHSRLDHHHGLFQRRHGESRFLSDPLKPAVGLLDDPLTGPQFPQGYPCLSGRLPPASGGLVHVRPSLFQLGQGKPRFFLAPADRLFRLLHLVQISAEIGDHPVDLSLAEPDLPADLDDILEVLVQLLFEFLPFQGVEPFRVQLLSDRIVLGVIDLNRVDQLDNPFPMHVFLDDAVFIIEIVHDALQADLPALQLSADIDHILEGDVYAEDGLHALLGALFDHFGDLYLALPAEQGNEPHLPHIHLHRIAGLTDRGQQTEEILALRVAPLTSRLFYDQFLHLVRIDDIDILPPKARNVIDLIEGNDL